MGQNKKYYWLKLKENFFEEKQIKYLRSLPDGDKIVIAYLKMQLKSLKTEGFIKYDSILPSNIDELAMVLDENINIIKLMIGALQKVNAVEILDDGSFYMIAMQDLIGKEGESAERVRRFRERQEQKLLQCNNDVTKCNTEIEKDIDIDKEKEIEIEKDTNIEIINDWEIKFDKFYKNYPKKVQKQNVKKWFKKNNPNDELFNIIMNKLEEFKQSNNWKKDNGQYIPYPTTWLNQKRWEDETIKQKSGFDDFIDMWKEAKDEEERNDTDNNTFSW